MLLAFVIPVAVSGKAFFPAGDIGAYAPLCGTGHSMILAAQAVPSAAQVPCIAALPAGWRIGVTDIASGRVRFWLDSDLAGPQAVTVTLSAACDVSGARPTPSGQPGTQRFDRPLSRAPRFAELRFYTFPGGCVTQEFNFTPGASRQLAIVGADAVAFMPRAALVEYVRTAERLVLCGRGGGVSGVSGPRAEPALLAAPGRDAVITAAVVALTAAVFVAVADHGVLAHIQRLDDAWLRLMISGRSAPVTVVAKFFNVLGLVYVTLPVRIAIAGFLALRRRCWRLAAFITAVVTSEILIGNLKGVYDRARPPESLVATSGASFPSGHSVAASVTVLAAVIALTLAGRHRGTWGVAAVGFSIMMALSRAYLGAHWLSDAIAGILLGTSCALLAALAVNGLQRRWQARRAGRPARTCRIRPGGPAGDDRASGRRRHQATAAVLPLPSPR